MSKQEGDAMMWLLREGSRLRWVCGLVLIGLCLGRIDADEPKPPRAARSVHLWWSAPEAVAFVNEITVEESVPGSYFMACGFNHGYFGIQELGSAKDKVALFSVWDPGDQNDPNSVPADRRVEVLAQADDVRIGRFGNEGTGAQCFYKLPWEVGRTYRFLVAAKVEANKTAYEAYIGRDDKSWKHLATFRTMTNGSPLRGLYSFIEDFRRDGKSLGQSRRAAFGNGWVKTTRGEWQPLTKARFTADATPVTNFDAGVKASQFWLATGGEGQNRTALKSLIEVESKSAEPPELPKP